MPKLYDHGVLVIGDAAMMISGRQGTDLAMLTGKYAAETVCQAKAKGDFSSDILEAYERRIDKSYFLKDIKEHKNVRQYYEKYPDSDYLISKVLNDIAYEYFKVEMETNEQKLEKIIKQVRTMQRPWKTITDIYNGIRNWSVF